MLVRKEYIPAGAIPVVQERLEKLNKRANKLGLPPSLSCEPTGLTRHIKVGEDVFLEPITREEIEVAIHGEMPKLADWELVGVIEPISQTSEILQLRDVPGKEIPASYRAEPTMYCDHCHTSRYRLQTFIVHNTVTNKYAQVGRNCLKDFLGHDPAAILAFYEMCESLSGEDWGAQNHTHEEEYSLVSFLTVVSACIREFGWVSGKTAFESNGYKTSTKDIALLALTNDGKFKKEPLVTTDTDQKAAELTIQYVRTLATPDPASNYEYNLYNLFKLDTVIAKNAGYVASAINFARGQLEKQASRLKYKQEFIGIPKQRLDFLVIFTSVHHTETEWGPLHIYNFLDLEHRALKWFSSTTVDIEEGHAYLIKGTIKDHELYKDRKSTVLSRVKILQEVKTEDGTP